MQQFLISAISVENGCYQFDLSCRSDQGAIAFSRDYFRRAFCSSLILFRLYEREGERIVEPLFFL